MPEAGEGMLCGGWAGFVVNQTASAIRISKSSRGNQPGRRSMERPVLRAVVVNGALESRSHNRLKSG
jgi:hypothetical protein